MDLRQDVRDIIEKSTVADVAIGLLIGGAVVAVANSVVDDVLMPPLQAMFGSHERSGSFFVLRDGSRGGHYKTAEQAREDGAVVLDYGNVGSSLTKLAAATVMAYGALKAYDAVMGTSKSNGGVSSVFSSLTPGSLPPSQANFYSQPANAYPPPAMNGFLDGALLVPDTKATVDGRNFPMSR